MPLDLSASSIDITRALCDIESVSGNEQHLADLIEETLTPLAHLEVIRHGNTVVARTNLGRDRRVAIAGHIDTVPVNGNLPTRFETREGEEILWGRGTVDMKGGDAVLLKLAAELTEPVSDVTWIWYDNEEVDASLNGLGLLAAARADLLQADFAILAEPTSAEIEGGCNGTLRAVIRTTGSRAHSARAWMGHNAIHDASTVLEILAEYRPARVMVDGLEYREGLNATGISGGIAGNVIPDECSIEVNYRFAPSKSPDEASEIVKKLFQGFDTTIVDVAPGARPGLDAPFAQEFIAATGGEPRPKYGWTDVSRFSALGIPAVNYGPGDPNLAHHDDEHVPVVQITAVESGLRKWLTQ